MTREHDEFVKLIDTNTKLLPFVPQEPGDDE